MVTYIDTLDKFTQDYIYKMANTMSYNNVVNELNKVFKDTEEIICDGLRECYWDEDEIQIEKDGYLKYRVYFKVFKRHIFGCIDSIKYENEDYSDLYDLNQDYGSDT
jgi:uncharacterized UPF0160 family protein